MSPGVDPHEPATADAAAGPAVRPHPGRRRRLLRAGGLAVVVGIPVAVLAVLVQSQASGVHQLDESAIRTATDITRDNPALYRALLIWQEAFQARWVNLAVSLVCLWAWQRHGLRTRALWAFVTLIVTWNLGLGAKYLVARTRPVVEDALTLAPGYSFPSGHATNTAAAGLILTVLVWPLLGRTGRGVVVALVSAAVVLTGLDRVFLGAHYPSDVVAGIALGGAMAGASFLGYVGWNPPVPGRPERTAA